MAWRKRKCYCCKGRIESLHPANPLGIVLVGSIGNYSTIAVDGGINYRSVVDLSDGGWWGCYRAPRYQKLPSMMMR